ncbi:respiratory nitrate reductase subunit gamma [Myxococcota bacterium]|nr:respiratory nitrate reductase subunit gamma [Myxococcota bacterium]MCZ7617464.1 heterodisulfide reductase-related iron-sulfur binding cluster [Myxococcota bacterium]
MPTREIYWNIVGGVGIYVFAAVAGALLAWGLWQRIRLWRLGGPARRTDRPAARVRRFVAEVFGQRRALRDPVPGIAHVLVFYGFLASFIATAHISVQEWTGIHFLRGRYYLGYSLLSDVFGLLAIAGLVVLLWRRAVVRPARLHSVLDDWIALGLLLLVFVQGFVIEGLRIATTELVQQPELARWSPGGWLLAHAFSGLPEATLRSSHRVVWWFHVVSVFAFLGYFVYGKLAHAFYGSANVLLSELGPTGRLVHPDVEVLADTDPDALARLGTSRIDGLSWKGLLDLDACMNCGRCEEVCPAHQSGVPLSPRKLIRDLKDHLTETGPALLAARAAGGAPPPADLAPLYGPGGGDGPAPAVLEVELWGCRTCGACQRECPVFIEHVPKIVDMRRSLVMTDARMSDEAKQMLRSLDDRGHPWVGASGDREQWFADLGLKVLGRGDTAEYLFWVGCTGALVERNVQVTRAVAKVLTAGGVDFAVLGAEESCTGDPARRVGGEVTYQVCAKTNVETFERYGVRKIVTSCPHCFNTLKNEYPDFGAQLEVVHHSELIAELVRDGRLSLTRKLDSITYHDPCYLGRHNEVYDAPRDVLRAVSAEGAFTELPRNRSRALCCGAGGGYAFLDDDPVQRINHLRIAEVKASGARTAAVSCPFCMQMFEDGLAALDPARETRALDIAEIVAEALGEPS